MKSFKSSRNSINLIQQITVLSLFFLIFFQELNYILPILIFSTLVILVSRDILLGIFSILFSLVLISLFAEFSILGKLILNWPVQNLVYIFLVTTILSAFIFKKYAYPHLNIFDTKQFLFALIFLMPAKLIFDLINSQTTDKALRYLVYTGEDNEAWLNGLASGFSLEGKNTFQFPASHDVRSMTHTILILFRELFTSAKHLNFTTENAIVLQRLYFVLILVILMLVTLGTYRIMISANLKPITAFTFSLFCSVCTYLGLASYAMVGHLTPIISLLFLFAMMFFFLLFSSKSQSRAQSIFTAFVAFAFFFAASNAWYPIAPAFFLAGIIFAILKIKEPLRQQFQKFDSTKIFWVATILLSAPMYFLIKKYLSDYISEKFSQFVVLVHWPGGTLNPGVFHLFALFGFLFFYNAQKNTRFRAVYNELFALTYISFAIYYIVILLTSISTSPYTIDYASNKMGLLFITLFLPFNIVFSLIYLIRKESELISSLTLLLFGFIFIIFAGSPTVSLNPNWNQPSFPFAVINRINSEDTYVWEKALIEKLNFADSNDKKLLCFDKYVSSPDVTQSCSRYAIALQGDAKSEFALYWLQVNWNASSESEFLDRIPKDFYEKYDFLFFDELRDAPVDSIENSVSELVPRK